MGVFADVYTSLHMTFQVYGLGHVAVDNFWELGVEHVYAFVVSNTHMKVYRDGIEMGARAVNGGIGHGVRDQFYIGGSACDSIQRWHANVKWFRVWTEALPEKMIKDLNNIPARPFFEHAQELNLNGVSDRVDVSDDFNTLQGGEMTFAFRATQKSIERNYERAWDWSSSCGSAH